jgi:hypothetical protein
MDFNHRHLSPALGAQCTFPFCKLLILKDWSGRKDLNLRPPGPEPTHGSRENQSKALNRRRIDEQLSPLIGLLFGLQIVNPTLDNERLLAGSRATRRQTVVRVVGIRSTTRSDRRKWTPARRPKPAHKNASLTCRPHTIRNPWMPSFH